ncbi:Asp-tRNA(Asn)/Glu-tRNA(Gln) amidotransferase subunit GatA, partial [Candidatus Woesebacteria bacterium]|nr:Asp-tRNA(Asn)/Glu-tRNA(Gln) amidotransferase subunit GatA [Candidatus Woesebacteria bacterium]
MNLPLTIKETQEGLLKKRFSTVDLVDEYLARIQKYNPELNAFLTVSDEVAYKQAKKIDRTLSDFPLFGVTVSHKDLYLTAGVKTTAGSKVLESYIPAYSATVVERLEKAGCIMLGKTNCDAWAHGASGENSDFGPSKNPWNPDYVPGGSSSGSAASVAANLTLVATGTDTGGSIREPANFCGIVGLKPTYGAVSRYGIVAMASSLDCPGPFARCVEDVETIFNVIKDEDGKDGTVLNTKYEIRDTKLKVGIP